MILGYLAAIFDVDGVLVDSLPAHLGVCGQLSREYGLGLDIPEAAAFRALARRGVAISPMEKFFRAVGFDAESARRADAEYERSFRTRFSPGPFPGVAEMLERLGQAGTQLGIVSSNTQANVERALGSLWAAFQPSYVLTRDHFEGKAAALRELVSRMRVPPEQVVYVGDQPGDAAAAREVGLDFVGVTYGWGIAAGDAERLGASRLADSPTALAVAILGGVPAS